MIKKIVFVLFILLICVGCGPKKITPGEKAKVARTQKFYFGVLVEDNSPVMQQALKDFTEEQKINFLVNRAQKFQVLPEEEQAALLANAQWITPAGVSIENPSLQLFPTKISWTETNGNEQTEYSVDGYTLIVQATVNASKSAETGEIILKIPQFKTLETLGLYVVEVIGNSPSVEFDSDTFVLGVIE
jgi:hypothetical protein